MPSQNGAHVSTRHHLPPEGISILHITINLIIKITTLLIEQQSADEHRDLRLDLKALYEVLALTRTAIQEYENRPLGPSLVNAVTPEVNRCRDVLQELFDRVNGTWKGLNQTSIGELWHSVFRSGWDRNELELLRTKLLKSRESLRGFLTALNSYVIFEVSCVTCTEISPIMN
jgi:hypothetical protein